MSKIARDWLKRQKIEHPTVKAVLAVIARSSDEEGCCTLPQVEIAKRAHLKERATRNALTVLQSLGVISRERRGAWGKAGRASDVALLSLHTDFVVSKEDTKAARDAGAPTSPLPARDAGAPTSPLIRNIYGTDGAQLHHCVGRVFFDGQRANWRAKLTVDGVDLDLGRHEAKDLAEAEIVVTLDEIEFTAAHPAGTPVHPKLNSSLRNLQGTDLCDFLFGSDREMRRPTGRAAGRRGSGGSSPGQGCGDEVPASRSETTEASE